MVFSAHRARPVVDMWGVCWGSTARLVASLFFADKQGWKKTSTKRLRSVFLHGARAGGDALPDGALCRFVVCHAHLRQKLNLRLAEHHAATGLLFEERAYAAAGLLQMTQHPRLQRRVCRIARRSKSRESDALVLRCIARASVTFGWNECVKIAKVALIVLEREVETQSSADCKLFRFLEEVRASDCAPTIRR